MAAWAKLVAGSLLTTAGWVTAAMVLKPESPEVLQSFVDKVQPGGPGWKRFPPKGGQKTAQWNVPRSLLQAFLGCVAVYGALLGVGAGLFKQGATAAIMLVLCAAAVLWILRLQRKT